MAWINRSSMLTVIRLAMSLYLSVKIPLVSSPTDSKPEPNLQGYSGEHSQLRARADWQYIPPLDYPLFLSEF